MSAVIWKWRLRIEDVQTVQAPQRTKWLTAQVQDGELCLWGMVPSGEAPAWTYVVAILGTGHPAERIAGRHWHYVSTVQMAGGALVWHVFVKELPS